MTKVSYRRKRKCGWCQYIPHVLDGGAIVKVHFRGEDERMYGEEAMNWISSVCRCQGVENQNDVVISEIRREGKRILKAGAPVKVQLKRRVGTRFTDGEVVECYANNDVKILLTEVKGHPSVRVPADEFVESRNR